MDEVPVVSRTQRRSERRQLLFMVVLVVTIAAASFFIGVMVGERGSMSVARGGSAPRQPMAQIAPPPLPATTATAPARLTFYDDLPKGNAAPLGSGINLPKGSYVPPPAPSQTPSPPASAPVPVASPAPAAVPPKAPAATAPVPAPAVATAAPKTSTNGAYVVQVAATKDQSEAKRLVDKLRGKGFAAQAERADLGAKGIWYRVVAGPYADRAAADKVASQMKQQKFSPMVRAR